MSQLYDALMQRRSIIESLRLILIVDCPASAGQQSYVEPLLPCSEQWATYG